LTQSALIEKYPANCSADEKMQRLGKKISALRLHITERVVELLDPQPRHEARQSFSEKCAMKRLLILAAIAFATATSSGCWHWFNRGASCNTCPPQGGAVPYGAGYGGDQYLDAPSADLMMPQG
jgi:hypothetical protein